MEVLSTPPEPTSRPSNAAFGSPEKAELAKHPNSQALNVAWEQDGTLPESHKVVRNPRRASGQLRQDMVERGSFFLAVQPLADDAAPDPFHGGGSDIHPATFARFPLQSKVRLGPSCAQWSLYELALPHAPNHPMRTPTGQHTHTHARSVTGAGG